MAEVVRDIQAAELSLDEGLSPYPDLVGALEYWDRLRGGQTLPLKADLDPLDITSILPRVMICDVLREENADVDFQYRLSGTGICNVHGTNPTGTRVGELRPAQYGALIKSHYTECVARAAPMAHIILLRTDEKQRSYARLLVPFTSDGKLVDFLMSIDSAKQNSLHDFLEAIEEVRRGSNKIGP